MTNPKWPWPGAQPVDRARDIARSLWTALKRVDPDAAEAFASAAAAAGEHWLTPEPARYGLEDTVPVIDAAELVGRSARWVYAWVAADREHRLFRDRHNRMRVRVRDLLEYLAHERQCDP